MNLVCFVYHFLLYSFIFLVIILLTRMTFKKPSQVVLVVENLPANAFGSLGSEDPLEKDPVFLPGESRG